MSENEKEQELNEEQETQEEQNEEIIENAEEETLDLEAIIAENGKLKEQLLLSAADMQNLRKRHDKQLTEAHAYAVTSFAKSLIPVMENLYRALEFKPNAENSSPELENALAGVEMTKNELLKAFEDNNITRLNPEQGEAFDYNLHQAIIQIPNDEVAPGTILNVVHAGYKLKDRLLQPAMVSVAKKS